MKLKMSLNIRTTRPVSGNKYYNTKSNGGYSSCIVGKPTDKQCNVLSNCVGNACAGFNEEHDFGYEKYHLTCNAENFIERAIASGLSVYKDPIVGGILVWKKGATLSGKDGAGHVEIVIDILERDSEGHPTKIKTHSSGYGNRNPWWKVIRSRGKGNWGTNSPYSYRGCIAPEAYKPEHKPESKPESKPEPQKPVTPSKFKVGDKVVPLKLVDYNRTKLIQYDPYYYITELKGNRAVLSANRNGKYYIWAALNTDNIKKI